MRVPYKKLIETYAEEFFSHSRPCKRSEGTELNDMIDELVKMDLDDHTKSMEEKKPSMAQKIMKMAKRKKKKADEPEKASSAHSSA